MNKPKLLDLFCGVGGAGMGYHRAGFDVTGVDIVPQPRYPFAFVQDDALSYLVANWWRYDAIHASPPCESHTQLKHIHNQDDTYSDRHIDLIPHTRYWLNVIDLPYIIENVPGAAKLLHNPVMLCGSQFGLKVYRHRYFESNIILLVPSHVPHRDKTPRAGGGLSPKGFVSVTGNGGATNQDGIPEGWTWGDYASFAMGIDWALRRELSKAIPPAYTEYLGRQLLRYVEAKAA